MSDKKKRNLIIILCILAVIIAILAVVFSPFGKKGNNGPGLPSDGNYTQTPSDVDTNHAGETDASMPDVSVVIPSSTEPVVNPNKNYTLYIDRSFVATESDDGTTVLTASENSNVKVTITPVRDMGYRECCRATEANHKKLSSTEALKIENTNSVYRSSTGDTDTDIVTTVYCVDDNKGGCIIIECKSPVSATAYIETINIMLSMFKVL